MIAVASALRILGGGLYYYGFSVFFLPLSHDLQLNRAATSLVFSLARAQGAFEGPVAGYFIDRFGPRPLIIMAITMTTVGHMLLSRVHSYFSLLLVYMGVVSLSFQAGFMDAPMVIANTWFIRKRALAMSVISSSIGIGGFLLTPLLATAIHMWGWRRAAFANGIAFLLAGLPLAFLVRRSPESMGLRPDGDSVPASRLSASGAGRSVIQREITFTLAEAIRTSPFWLLTIGTGLRIAVLSAITVHYVPMMVWKGFTEERAAFLLGIQAIMVLPSCLLAGWLADRFNKARFMAVAMALPIIGLLSLIYVPKPWQLWLFIPLFTVVEATFPANWAAVGEFFGRSHFAKIRGAMTFVQMWGSVLGPVAGGAIYDATGSYNMLLWWLVIVLLIVSCLYALVVKPAVKTRLAEREISF